MFRIHIYLRKHFMKSSCYKYTITRQRRRKSINDALLLSRIIFHVEFLFFNRLY